MSGLMSDVCAIWEPSTKDLWKSSMLTRQLPLESALPNQSRISSKHLYEIAEIFTRNNAHGILGLHLLHRHFDIPVGTVLLGSTWSKPYCRWTTATEIEGTDWSETGGAVFILTAEGWHPYEYLRKDKPDLSCVKPGFLPQITEYLVSNQLSQILGLQILDRSLRTDQHLIELSLREMSVMFFASDLKGCVPTRQTGWRFELHDGQPRVCQYNESHGARPDGSHDIYNQGQLDLRYGDFEMLRYRLMRDGFLKIDF
ncbi:uncharacterized protein PV09_09367 [Verruconis gallopava]|uniref:Uncharacterized protein n=1 Tax=Verruconis gallopava TaxID=253628 RepID=A0A0D2AIV5_9PEZI|nr:uncharacterized protein PV09_09367 [Verruconis gallopava]KIV98873.1 hypothetical protein PV09_09367 [Verruconis gallopava]